MFTNSNARWFLARALIGALAIAAIGYCMSASRMEPINVLFIIVGLTITFVLVLLGCVYIRSSRRPP